ncbi:MAG TPA: thiolase domain-containing protein, partial [Candidatus Bathyarchaeota archaeon]|nr:thiolase domain-containing protein [Candidatus Bathyarchaeota archaeon]
MRKVAVIGIGHSKFGRRQDVNVCELAFEAIKPAMEEAGITAKDVEFMPVGTIGMWYEEGLPAVMIADYCGISGAGLA